MYSTIKKWARENREAAILVVAVVVAFFIYSNFYIGVASDIGYPGSAIKFNSPDETANYFFAGTYAKDGILRVFEPLNLLAENRIQPRSMAVIGSYLVPGSFLGLIITYGWIAKIFSPAVLLFLTPLLAGFAVFCFYEIIRKIFGRQIAFWSALLLLIHPAFWYYSARGLFPNVLFISFLIFSAYFMARADVLEGAEGKTKYVEFILAGLFFGLAMTVRLSEIIWVGTAFLVYFVICRKKFKLSQIALFVGFSVITFSPIFAYNNIFYGNPFLTAYNLGDGAASGPAGQGVGWLLSFTRYIFPFGFHLKNILKNFANYFAGMFWWLAIPAAYGVLLYFKKIAEGKLERKIKIYLGFAAGIALFLFAYYGSWLFYDNPAEEVSVGTSYVRYWLPVYLLSLPVMAFALLKFIGRFHGGWKKIIASLVAVACLLLSAGLVYYDRNDGLVAVGRNMRAYTEISAEVDRTIEPDAVIIVDQADKIFFPEHQVIQPFRDNEVYKLIPSLSREVPLYYYGITLPEKDIDYLYAKKINPEKVELVRLKDFGDSTLYKLEPKNKN